VVYSLKTSLDLLAILFLYSRLQHRDGAGAMNYYHFFFEREKKKMAPKVRKYNGWNISFLRREIESTLPRQSFY